jgi:hypothetical protein
LLAETGQLVSELIMNKYLKHHRLSTTEKKADKVRRIMFHVFQSVPEMEIEITPESGTSDDE